MNIEINKQTNTIMKHSLMIMEQGFNIWITRLTSVNPKLIEYRFTFSDGVVRYLTMDEIVNSPFNYMANHIKLELTDAIDESRIKVENGQLYERQLN